MSSSASSPDPPSPADPSPADAPPSPSPKPEPHWLSDNIVGPLPARFPRCWLTGNAGQDYEGQRLAELLVQIIMVSSGVLGFFLGLAAGSLRLCFAVVFFGGLACSAICIPPWPVFKRHPVKWLDDIRTERQKAEDEAFAGRGGGWWPF
ncbi:microsomal signal peptidase 12 kDa subunit-domain-containing protein [Hyaloraphidium curvatum]|nr:microsomal signal peptidase 12 kDa subunit-domain-containing protein [Hyaloraphidium curvatum]